MLTSPPLPLPCQHKMVSNGCVTKCSDDEWTFNAFDAYSSGSWLDIVTTPCIQPALVLLHHMPRSHTITHMLPLPTTATHTRSAMVSRLARRMERRYASAAPERPLGPPAGAEPTPSTLPARYSSALGALFDVYSMMEPARLAQQTQLLDPSGRNVRLGSSLLLCTGPGGKVMLQGESAAVALSPCRRVDRRSSRPP